MTPIASKMMSNQHMTSKIPKQVKTRGFTIQEIPNLFSLFTILLCYAIIDGKLCQNLFVNACLIIRFSFRGITKHHSIGHHTSSLAKKQLHIFCNLNIMIHKRKLVWNGLFYFLHIHEIVEQHHGYLWILGKNMEKTQLRQEQRNICYRESGTH
ncbi:hypothetical protein ACJX0J_037275, partial [Zea mays]